MLVCAHLGRTEDEGSPFGEVGGDPLYGLGGDDGGGSAGEKWRWTVLKGHYIVGLASMNDADLFVNCLAVGIV
jgi:hypothetical protein